MAVYYKLRSAKEFKDYDKVAFDGNYISVLQLKVRIFELKKLGKGRDFDLVVTNVQTNKVYDERELVPKYTSVLIHRIPGIRRKPIVVAPDTEIKGSLVEDNPEFYQTLYGGSFATAEPITKQDGDDFDWHDFGSDVYGTPETVLHNNNEKEDEESMIKTLVETPAIDWQCQPSDSVGAAQRRLLNGKGGFVSKTPQPGYVCRRCKLAGHFIQHCPTNDDRSFDIKRPPTGIPMSMLLATPDGSYVLRSGSGVTVNLDESAFDKEMEGMPSTRPAFDLPPELHCPICEKVMKYAMITSKCCFATFCDQCIRDHLISKSTCVCGATNVFADDLLPNKTVRDTISRMQEYDYPSSQKSGSSSQVQDLSTPNTRTPSPTQSDASKEPQVPAHKEDEAMDSIQKEENLRTSSFKDVSRDLKRCKEAILQCSGQLEEGKSKLKKRKKNHMMVMPPPVWPFSFGYTQYWNGMLDCVPIRMHHNPLVLPYCPPQSCREISKDRKCGKDDGSVKRRKVDASPMKSKNMSAEDHHKTSFKKKSRKAGLICKLKYDDYIPTKRRRM